MGRSLELIVRVSKKSHRIMPQTDSMKYCLPQPILSTLSLFRTEYGTVRQLTLKTNRLKYEFLPLAIQICYPSVTR